jgi:hypothetical protein
MFVQVQGKSLGKVGRSHNGYLCNICGLFLGHIHNDDLKEDVIGRAFNTQGNNGKDLIIFFPNYERNRLLGRRRHVRKDNIKKDFKGAGCKNVS